MKRCVMIRSLLLLCLGAGVTFTSAQTTNPPPVSAVNTNNSVKEISPGILEVGKVRLDKSKRSITFPATVNMTEGAVEYFLVSSIGKLHESIFRADAEPYHIHLAALLLNVKGGEAKKNTRNVSQVSGDAVNISVNWVAAGKTNNLPAEDFIFSLNTKAKPRREPWIYTGSRIFEGNFVAQRDGSIVAIIADGDALINNPKKDRDDDEIWRVNTTNVPALQSPVQIVLEFVPSSDHKKSSP